MPDVARYLDPLTVERLSHLRPAARRGLADALAAGAHRGRFANASADFRHHRPYARGDDPRRLDWRALARTDRPFVRQPEPHTNLRALLVLDASGSMGYADKADWAARLVAALAHLVLSAGEAVGLAVTTGAWVEPAVGSGQLARLLDGLDRARPAGPADWPAVADRVAGRLRRRAVVVVVSDLLAPVASVGDALARLRRGRHDLACCRLLHPDERHFPFRGTLRLNGLEGERPTVVDPATARATYLANLDRHRRQLVARCRSLGVGLHEASTIDPVADTVADLLGVRR